MQPNRSEAEQPHPALTPLQKQLQQFLDYVDDSRQPAAKLYKNFRLSSLCKALNDSYPAVKKILGSRYFNVLCRVYAESFPSQQWDLNLYGKSFASFLSAQQQARAAPVANWPLLASLAELEYAFCRLYYGGDIKCLSLDLHSTNTYAALDSSTLLRLVNEHSLVELVGQLPASARYFELRPYRYRLLLSCYKNRTLQAELSEP
ncbi:putative DNA-binding domain-containing protein [Agaribacterium haliotis]|uniref:HvfC/BufC family peptide modification chaperone n=1 Tax=Agaribacterium haliotis TaxID=2013869 RepID=UPI000BB54F49|nr:putative DNA-binding domain-containing protein [Agaribacterium haliotis]